MTTIHYIFGIKKLQDNLVHIVETCTVLLIRLQEPNNKLFQGYTFLSKRQMLIAGN